MSFSMTPRDDHWLRDALHSALTLQRNTAHLSQDAMMADAWTLGAVERRLEVIGEALRRARSAALGQVGRGEQDEPGVLGRLS